MIVTYVAVPPTNHRNHFDLHAADSAHTIFQGLMIDHLFLLLGLAPTIIFKAFVVIKQRIEVRRLVMFCQGDKVVGG